VAEFEPGYEDRWDADEYKAILRHLSESCPTVVKRGRVFLLVRTGRALRRLQASGQFSDAPDTAQREGVLARQVGQELPVLMLIRQNGSAAEGWRDCPFWWPVIYPPANTRTTLFAHAR